METTHTLYKCIGNGSVGAGCGYEQEVWGSGVCKECGGMLQDEQGKHTATLLIASWRAADVTRTERGGPGHFVCASECLFRRNTLLEYNKTKLVISTVGNWHIDESGNAQLLSPCAYYETLVYFADTSVYHDIDVTRQVSINCQSTINSMEGLPDTAANNMHENIVGKMFAAIQEM